MSEPDAAPSPMSPAAARTWWRSLDVSLQQALLVSSAPDPYRTAPPYPALPGDEELARILALEWVLLSKAPQSFAPLAALPCLRRLELECAGAPWDTLREVRQLTMVEVDRFEPSSFACFAPLDGLSALSIRDCPRIADSSGLEPLERLELLQLGGFIDDASGLRNKPELRHLSFGVDSAAFDWPVLSRMPLLSGLDVAGDALRDLDFLSEAHGLESLRIEPMPMVDGGVTAVRSLAGLEGHPLYNLGVVRSAALEDVAALAGSSTLAHHRLRDCTGHIAWNRLGALPALETLDAMGCTHLDDLTAFASSPLLRSVEVSRTAVSELSPLARCHALAELSCHSMLAPPLRGMEQIVKLGAIERIFVSPPQLAPPMDAELPAKYGRLLTAV